MFSPSNKIHREVGRAKDLSAPLYYGYLLDDISAERSQVVSSENADRSTWNDHT